MEICAGDVVAGQEDRVPGYLCVASRSWKRVEEEDAVADRVM